MDGAERVLVDLANKLSEKYEITIFTIYSNGELEKELSKKIKIKSLYKKTYLQLNNIEKRTIPIKILLNKKHIYNKYIKGNYDIEIAFLEGPITRLFSVKNKNVRKIAWIHNDISQVFGKSLKATIKKKIDKKTYSKYELLVFVSRENLRNFNRQYKEIRNEYLEKVKKDVIYNYIEKEKIIKKAEEKVELPYKQTVINFVTVARLVKQKAIDRLIKVHKKLIEEGLKHEIYVIGDGPERENLEKLIKESNVSNTFHLLGQKQNPYPYIKNADYFCLLSNFEGYGMVLEEAKILGKSIIITNTAAREAVEKYKNSEIVENTEEGIYRGLKATIKNPKKNKQEDKPEYNNQNIIEKIEKIIENETWKESNK